MLGPPTLIAVTALAAFAATVQGSVGFGFALLCAPLLALIDPAFVPAPVIMAGLVLTVLVAVRERSAVEIRRVGWILAGRLPGAVAGAFVLAVLSAEHSNTLFAVLVLVAVALSAAGLSVPARRSTFLVAGLASGVMGTVSSIGGPPVALVLQHSAGPTLRGTLSAYFICSTLMSLGALAAFGLLGMAHLHLATLLIPGTLLGFALSGRTRAILDRGYTRAAVLTLAALAAVGVLAR